MNRHDFLSGLHDVLRPRSYLEIGINDGRGLARSSTRTIGVDPAFAVKVELSCDLQLVRATSDDFFARADAIAWFGGNPVDLAFIDGMHLSEFALRDFMNVERLTSGASVVVFDDMLPRTVNEAARDRHTSAWAGDVYKVADALHRFRPDLVVVPIDTEPTGLVLVAGLDPASTALPDHYDRLVADFDVPDPQPVPDEVLHRTRAADPRRLLESGVWHDLLAERAAGTRPESVSSLADLRGTADYVSNPPPEKPWSPPGAGKRAPGPSKSSAPGVPADDDASLHDALRQLRRSLTRRL